MEPTTEEPTPMHRLIIAMLAAGLPLTLLLDLAHPDGPDSAAIYQLEQPAGHHGGPAS